jgi:membrane protease YdiL (CAAX protease family)
MNEVDEKERATARRGLLIYFAVLIAGSSFLESKILRVGESIEKVPALILALMYMPAAASFLARFALKEGFADISLRFGGRKSGWPIFLAWGYPIAVGVLAYGLAWVSGLAEFQRPLPPRSHLYMDSAAANLLVSFLFTATLGTAVSCLSAFGEEVGWRGYMLTRLISAGVPRPVFTSGWIWAFWHVPLILSGQYAAGSHPRLSESVFVIGTIVMAYVVAYVRLQSGSLWPAVMLHGAWNAIIQGTFDRATTGTPSAVGESGWMTMIASIIIVLFITRGVWTLQRQPGLRMTLPSGRPASIRAM